MKPLRKTSAPGSPSSGKLRHHAIQFHYSAIELLVTLLLFFVATPFVDILPNGEWIESILLTLVMVSAVLATGGKRRILAIALVLITPALIGKWLNFFAPGLVSISVLLVATVAFFAFIVGQLLIFILHAPRVDTNVLCAGLAGYLMLGLLWIPIYELTAQLTPGAFAFNTELHEGTMKGFNAFYFSLVTLSTVGYGDVAPVSRVARMFAIMEAISGLFYMAVLVSRLVAVHSAQNLSQQTKISATDTNSESK